MHAIRLRQGKTPGRARAVLAVLAGGWLCCLNAHAQCTPRWLPGESVPGVSGTVYAALALPGGDAIAGGAFSVAGGVSASNIARWHASTNSWSAIGPGVNGPVFSIVRLPTGELIVGGAFTNAGVVGVPSVARLDLASGTWSDAGGGVGGGPVAAMAVTPDGDVAVVGSFSHAGGVPNPLAARFSPATSTWTWLNPPTNRGLVSVAAHPSGDLYIGGDLTGFPSASGIARRSVSGAWSPLGSGLSGGDAAAIAVLPGGDIVAGGQFVAAGGFPAGGVARWRPASNTWAAVGAGVAGQARLVNTVLVLPSGDLVIGGNFSGAGGAPAPNIARWNAASSSWSGLGAGTTGPVTTLALRSAAAGDPDVLVGGSFAAAGGVGASNVATVDHLAGSWTALGSGVNGAINALAILSAAQGGDIFAGGTFTRAGPGPAMSIARLHPATRAWTPLGAGVNGQVLALTATPTGDLIVGGEFSVAGGGPASRIARWSPSSASWSNFGSGITVSGASARVQALAVAPSGDVYAGGAFTTAGGALASNIARWSATGGTWSNLGSGANLSINALAFLPDGDLIAGGIFSVVGGVPAEAIARYRPSTHSWTALGPGISGTVNALLVLPDGSLMVGGDFTTAGGVAANNIARLNPSTGAWSALGLGVDFACLALAHQPDPLGGPGDLLAAGSFSIAGNQIATRIARFRLGTGTWLPLGLGLNATVRAVAVHPGGPGNPNSAGDIFAGGNFTASGSIVSSYLATWSGHPACAADFDCSGSLNVDDLFAYLGAWFAGHPAADVDGSGGLTTQDLFTYIGTWFGGC